MQSKQENNGVERNILDSPPSLGEITLEHLQIIRKQCPSASDEKIVEAYRKNGGDIVNTIMELPVDDSPTIYDLPFKENWERCNTCKNECAGFDILPSTLFRYTSLDLAGQEAMRREGLLESRCSCRGYKLRGGGY